MKTIIFLFFPPTIKKFLFENNSEKGINFLDFEIFKNEEKKEKNDDNSIKKIEEEFKEKEWDKLVLINFPYQTKQFEKIKQLLLKNNGKLEKHILLVNVTKYQVLEEIKKNYLVCPLCEYLHQRKKQEEEENQFFCLIEEKTFELEKIEELNTKILNYYLTHNKEIINLLLIPENGLNINKKLEINISETREILEGEVKKKITSVIENL